MKNAFRRVEGTGRTVLVVDDELINRDLLGNILDKEYDVLFAENGKEALKLIKECAVEISLIFLDIVMPGINGFEVLKELKGNEDTERIPVIVLTADVTAELQSIELGAADFIKKPYDIPEVILARARRIIELAEDTNIIQSAERDSMTGLYTKDFFYEYSRLMERNHRDSNMDAVVIKIEHFHLINELFGVVYAKKILRHVGETMKGLLREIKGVGCRAEDNIFYMYCPHQDDYNAIAEIIINGLPELFDMPNAFLGMGVCTTEYNSISVEKRFERAKKACDSSHLIYATRVTFYDEELYENDRFSEQLIHDMREALENHDFKVYYQPKYDISGDTPVLSSAEGLVRWQHPKYGMISPGDFVPILESNGLIQLLDHYTWKEVGKQIREWKDKYNVSVPVSINVSRMDIYDPRIKEKLCDILESNGLTTDDIFLEVTESVYAEDASKMIRLIEELRDLGFKIEMDDFGSGYSSLNMLNEVEIDTLKLDMQFVKNMLTNKKSLRLVQLIIDIAKVLKVPVIAEGVENKEQCRILKEMGCNIVQGYYFSRAVSPEEFGKLIESTKVQRNNG